MSLTDFEMKALEALRGTGVGGRQVRPSSVGYMLWEQCDPNERKPNPSPQGLALFAGKFLSSLCKQGLAAHWNGYYITGEGKKALQ